MSRHSPDHYIVVVTGAPPRQHQHPTISAASRCARSICKSENTRVLLHTDTGALIGTYSPPIADYLGEDPVEWMAEHDRRVEA